MQTVYAYRVLRQATYELAKEHLSTCFEPDYMAEVPEDRKQLKKEENLALASFNEWLKDHSYNYKEKPEKVVQAVTKTLEFYNGALKKDKERLEKKLVLEIEEIYDSYLKILGIGPELKHIAEANEAANLAANKLIGCLSTNPELQKKFSLRGISWQEHIPVLRKFFKNSIRKEAEYSIYEELSRPDFEDDKQIALHIFKKMIFEDEIIENHFEEVDLYWSENKNILKGMIKKTIKDVGEDCEEHITLLELSNNWEEDKVFIRELFDNTVHDESLSVELIANKSKNWEIDRLALTDRIILNMAISEMINFSNIPVKVTINEYIEISKSYSTPQSKQFVNGILDSISTELTEQGRIKKSGRGLIDNKL